MSGSPLPKVLLVDDELRVLRGYRDLLRKEPYELLTASSGLEALETLAKNRVDVLVSDERMPSMSGAELLERVHRSYPDIVRIMLTGHASLHASVRAINDGLYRLLSKPIAPDEMCRVIRDALNLKNLRLANLGSERDRHLKNGFGRDL